MRQIDEGTIPAGKTRMWKKYYYEKNTPIETAKVQSEFDEIKYHHIKCIIKPNKAKCIQFAQAVRNNSTQKREWERERSAML